MNYFTEAYLHFLGCVSLVVTKVLCLHLCGIDRSIRALGDILFVGFSCSLLPCLGYQCMVDSLCLLGSVVTTSDDSPIDLGLKLSTLKGVLWTF